MNSLSDLATTQEAVAARSEPDLSSYLPHLKPVITITHLLHSSIHTVLLPLAAPHATVHRDMSRATAATISRIEEKINGILQRTIDVIQLWTSKLLASQKKSDFRPRDDLTSTTASPVEMLQTPTCFAVHQFLTNVHALVTTHVFPPPAGVPAPADPNATAFLSELALAFRAQLLDHFKRFPVNAAGGLLVTKDLARYTDDLLRAWPLADPVRQSLDVLAELGNLFVIGPEALRERLRASSSSTATATAARGAWPSKDPGDDDGGVDLRAYVLRREDAGSVGVQSVLSAL